MIDIHSVQKCWKWDEKFNDTPYKLDADIKDLLQQGLVRPSTDNLTYFLGNAQGAPKYIAVVDGKVDSIFFSSCQKSTFPSITKGLWEMKQPEFIQTVKQFLKRTTIARPGPTLLVDFLKGAVTIAILYRT